MGRKEHQAVGVLPIPSWTDVHCDMLLNPVPGRLQEMPT